MVKTYSEMYPQGQIQVIISAPSTQSERKTLDGKGPVITPDAALQIFKNIKTPKTAKNTITDISQFKKELNKINKQGYAFDDEEWFNGMVGLSLPIKNLNNELCFCLSTHTAKSRKNIDDLKKILPPMLSAASNLKKVLFKN